MGLGHTHQHGAAGHAREGPGSELPAGDRSRGHPHVPGRASISRRLAWVLGFTATFMVAEVVGGVLSGSLALLADAGHMFSDVTALALSLVAIGLARRPPTERRTYGYARFEILAALANGATLLVVAGLIVGEAWERAREPVPIDGVVMFLIAGLGLVVNVVAAVVLHAQFRAEYRRALGQHGDGVGFIGRAPRWPSDRPPRPSCGRPVRSRPAETGA